MRERLGNLVIIGGGEDRRGDMDILSRYVELCGGPDCSIAVLTAASAVQQKVWETYDAAFGELNVRRRFAIGAESRDDADDPERARKILDADGIFMSGGDQKRLVEILAGSRVHHAMRKALEERSACIGGTSAGASAMARCMLARGPADKLPETRTARLAAGLAFLQHAIIDQHFSERQRLARLLSAVAQNPDMIGVGIDEDTALILGRDGHIEVLGTGAVTLIDGRRMASNIAGANGDERLELANVILHLLPAGNRYDIRSASTAPHDATAKEALISVLRIVGKV